jgi:hypothetical protein
MWYFKHWKQNNFKLGLLYPGRLSFITEGQIKTFHDKGKLKQCMIIKSALQKILKDILHIEDKHSAERMGIIKL